MIVIQIPHFVYLYHEVEINIFLTFPIYVPSNVLMWKLTTLYLTFFLLLISQLTFYKTLVFSNVSGTKDWNHKDSWNGAIIDVADIEENIWAPRLGIKGKVDVTVKTSARNKQKVKDFYISFKKLSMKLHTKCTFYLFKF